MGASRNAHYDNDARLLIQQQSGNMRSHFHHQKERLSAIFLSNSFDATASFLKMDTFIMDNFYLL
jgi:hypothetical protein